ncbi:autotransporter-associated beta strand repeat-containing protein, partial [Salmonella enterica]
LELSQGTLDNNVTGEGQIVKSGSDELIVTGDNTYSGGTTITGGILAAKDAASLGSGDVDIAENAKLELSQGTLDNNVTGEGQIVKSGSDE